MNIAKLKNLMTKKYAADAPWPVQAILILLFFSILSGLFNVVLEILLGNYGGGFFYLLISALMAYFFYGLINLKRWAFWTWLVLTLLPGLGFFVTESQWINDVLRFQGLELLGFWLNLILFLSVLPSQSKFR